MRQMLLLFFSCNLATFNYAQTLDVNNQGAIKTHTGSQIGFFGDLNNDGSFLEDGGRVGFYNTQYDQTISGANTPQFYDLEAATTKDLYLEVTTQVHLALLFNKGRIVTPRANPEVYLSLTDTDLYTNEDDDRYVDGYTSYQGLNAYTFPIDDAFRIQELSIEQGASVNRPKAAYFYENPEEPSTFDTFFNTQDREKGIEEISKFEFWDLDGSTPTTVTLSWDIMSNISQLVINEDLSELKVVGWNIRKGIWEDLGNTQVSGTIENGAITSTRFTPNDYEILTFAGTYTITDTVFGEIKIYNALSVNDDIKNSYFRVEGISKYLDNSVKIYNRWGVLVFERQGYGEPDTLKGEQPNSKEVFTGYSFGRSTITPSKKLPTGTYFYVIDIKDTNQNVFKKAGYLYLK